MTRFLVWGGGGHGKVIADLVRAAGGIIEGFIDADPVLMDREVEPGGARVVLAERTFREMARDGRLGDRADAVALAIGSNAKRLACLETLGNLAAPPLLHPTAAISPSAVVGRATVVLPRVVINAAARLGEGVIANSGCIIEHDCMIADGVHVSPGAILAGGVRVGARTWIGAGATVIQGIAIGADVIIGAGSVVIRDVPDDVRLAGVPARPIHSPRGE